MRNKFKTEEDAHDHIALILETSYGGIQNDGFLAYAEKIWEDNPHLDPNKVVELNLRVKVPNAPLDTMPKLKISSVKSMDTFSGVKDIVYPSCSSERKAALQKMLGQIPKSSTGDDTSGLKTREELDHFMDKMHYEMWKYNAEYASDTDYYERCYAICMKHQDVYPELQHNK